MKTACIALKQFLFAGVVLAVGQLFKTTKIHAGELETRGLARLATAEELQEDRGIDDEQPAGDATSPEPEQSGNEKQELNNEQSADDATSPEPEQPDNEKQELNNEQSVDDALGSDAGSSEEPSAPVPKRRGRKQSS